MEVAVSGRDVTLSGTADTPVELDRLVAGLDAIRGRRVVNAERVTVLPEIAPWETALAKGADGTMAATGYAPSAAARDAITEALPAVMTLPLGHGAPDGWRDVLLASKAALAPLDEGSAALTGSTLAVSGVAATPIEEATARGALAQLDGFDTVVAIEVLDPGIIDFSLSYDAGTGYGLAGTLPGNLGPEGIAEVLGLDALEGAVSTTFAEVPDLAGTLETLKGFAGMLETFTLDGSNDGVAITGAALAGLDAGVVARQIAAALGADSGLTIQAGALPEDGVERINAATGLRQAAHGGNWLTVPDFDPTKAACAKAAAGTVEAAPILFVTGSAELDPVSLATINDIAGIVRLCTQGEGMRMTVGGHTDAQGDDTANYSLSVARAKAVRDALVARGVASEKITAVGYGETEPVADNETEEGRALNRRTTFAWPE